MDLFGIIGIVAKVFGEIRKAGADGKIELVEVLDILVSLATALGFTLAYSMPRNPEEAPINLTLSAGVSELD